MSSPVHLAREGAVALIRVDNPPVNALGQPVRAGLLEAFAAAEADAQIKVVVLLCAGTTFIAGADIREFGKPPQAPFLVDVTQAIENFNKPSLAVIHGSALGGGLEIALACHYRIARRNARLGLPEVNLGLLPGAGGTQRLPRLAGVAVALDMIVGGEPITADEAERNGIVDQVFEGELLSAALAFAEQLLVRGTGPRRTGEADVPVVATANNASLLETKRDEVQRSLPGLFSPLRCIAAIEAATVLPLAEGLKREGMLFQECLQSPQRLALVHKFFAERKAGKIKGLDSAVETRPVASVAVIGGGTMGVGIALSLASAGLSVKLLELDADRLATALQRATDTLGKSVRRGSLSEQAMRQRLALIEGVTDYAALAEVDLAIEAVFEDIAAKQAVFEALDRVCKPGAILASNTSSLDLDRIAAFTRRPQDVVGLHFFSPANVMRLLEVVRGAQTSDSVLASAMQLGKRLKKIAVVVGVCDGFVGNRMALSYVREAELLVQEGASVQRVDGALREFGMAMGPFAMLDMSGLDIWQSMRQRQRATLGAGQRLPNLLDRLCAVGRFGQKSGAGFYLYPDGSRTPQPDLELVELLDELSSCPQLDIDPQSLWQRPLYALINEGARILEEGIAQRASDIDVIFLTGYGFPAQRGGPMFYADQLGLDKVLQCIRGYHRCFGANWQPAPLLERLVAEGKTFAELDQQG
ncbi:3-hydroxyacyl-CoA dehydrogenase NAD-binding domain-containing protein [Pseudomonas lopnurensis]|uniref:3-hydroxyacyl-CoA dehydrogenase NAD-binding domain-containing protein n=1 Tax=Pseudomonas lopnurensis TaxID=1477517 RepID=UPI00187B0448|nr:3-hydroxyacyl-CoA dehydrogenase NAD-binding domain-containing protein [Pseudomonas lopnurensis]MBE7373787.1 enoyl-CoA hydratase/isomerase family protein [Pseudomonas lopnurensis]